MMPDHWGFVAMAYGLALVLLGGYWRRLARLEREAVEARHGAAWARPSVGGLGAIRGPQNDR